MEELMLFAKRFLLGRCTNKTIGLFGTCDTIWRKPYILQFEQAKISYFNPEFSGRSYTQADSVLESEHLSSDRVILIPALATTDGIVTLSEINIAVAKIIMSWNRHLIILIEPEVNTFLVTDEFKAKKSNQMRMLNRAHLAHLNHPRVHIVESQEEMWNMTWQVIKSL